MDGRVLATSENHRISKTATRASLCTWLCLFLAAGLLYASATASISGSVTDPSGAAVVGATVTVTNQDTGIVLTQQSN